MKSNGNTLANIKNITEAFGMAVSLSRVQSEDKVHDEGKCAWLPWAGD